jgi:tRNA(adenine34) deaminase
LPARQSKRLSTGYSTYHTLPSRQNPAPIGYAGYIACAAKPVLETIMSLDTDEVPQLHEKFMRQALREAEAALKEDEVPIGAVIVYDDPAGGAPKLIAAAHNEREQLRDPTAHAEMIAITQAAQALNNWRLERCTLYVTLEPCPMCAGAIVLARMPRVVYGAADPKAGAANTLFQLLTDSRLNHRSEVVPGILGEECALILSRFFADKRANAKR